MSTNVDLAPAVRRCCGTGVCSRSLRPLQGIQLSPGRYFAMVAEPYPRPLCHRLAYRYGQAIRWKRARQLNKLWWNPQKYSRAAAKKQPENWRDTGRSPLLKIGRAVLFSLAMRRKNRCFLLHAVFFRCKAFNHRCTSPWGCCETILYHNRFETPPRIIRGASECW